MKSKLLLFFLLLASPLLAQLRGAYCHDFGAGKQCITFHSNGKFEYEHTYAKGRNQGKGTYALRNDSLILSFARDSTALLVTSPCSTSFQAMKLSDKKEMTLDLSYYDPETGEPMIFAAIRVEGTNKGVMTDIDGRARLRLPADSSTVTLAFSYVGYATCEVQLRCDHDYRIKVYAGPASREKQEIKNREFAYAIKVVDKETIELKNHKSSPFVVYKRK